jgi:hypothetical protein
VAVGDGVLALCGAQRRRMKLPTSRAFPLLLGSGGESWRPAASTPSTEHAEVPACLVFVPIDDA